MDMCHGRPCRSFWLYLLLIAAAIQGVTPDAQDLASLNSFFLLCPSLADAENLAGNDELPDEVCGPAKLEVNGILCDRGEIAGLVSIPSFSSSDYLMLASSIAAVGAGARRGTNRRLRDPIYCLCRLQC
jgi:hypothetical protein